MVRSLFFLVNDAINGGNLILTQLALRLQALGQSVDIATLMPPETDLLTAHFQPKCAPPAQILSQHNYDFVFLASVVLVGQTLPYVDQHKLALVCQGYESFLYGATYEECLQEVDSIAAAMALPQHIIATSHSIQQIIQQRLNRASFYLPLSVQHRGLRPRPKARGNTKRILMVGSYAAPFKGMQDGLRALELVSRQHQIELLLLTQEHRMPHLLEGFSFPIRLQRAYSDAAIDELLGDCHLYLCSSWYEGFGLPALEAFACRRPVVSTRNFGVHDYGIHERNLLLSEAHQPEDIAFQVERLLSDDRLVDELTDNALQTNENFTWDRTMERLLSIQSIMSSAQAQRRPSPQAAAALMERLEADGIYMPPDIYAKLTRAHQPIEDVCCQFVDGRIDDRQATFLLKEIANDISPHLGNRRAQYYPEFKRYHDLCRLMAVVADREQFAAWARRTAARALAKQ